MIEVGRKIDRDKLSLLLLPTGRDCQLRNKWKPP